MSSFEFLYCHVTLSVKIRHRYNKSVLSQKCRTQRVPLQGWLVGFPPWRQSPRLLLLLDHRTVCDLCTCLLIVQCGCSRPNHHVLPSSHGKKEGKGGRAPPPSCLFREVPAVCPFSGTGTWARGPTCVGRWGRSLSQVTSHPSRSPRVQEGRWLLQSCLSALPPGGASCAAFLGSFLSLPAPPHRAGL